MKTGRLAQLCCFMQPKQNFQDVFLLHYLIIYSFSPLVLIFLLPVPLFKLLRVYSQMRRLPGMTRKRVTAVGLSSAKGNRKGPLRGRWERVKERRVEPPQTGRKDTDNSLEELWLALISLGLNENLSLVV